MKWIDWIKPGVQVKRWIFMVMLGTVMLSLSIAVVMNDLGWTIKNSTFMVTLLMGLFLLFYGTYKGILTIIHICNNTLLQNKGVLKNNQTYLDRRIKARGPRVVVIGGGTGLSILLRGLKLFTSNITAIVTVADDGGGSGKLREDLGMLPPGDIRNCILALAEMEPTMEKLLQYRFTEGSLKGQSFGNLLIASMNEISGNFEEAIKSISEVLAVTGKVLPVTLENIILYAKLENGKIIKGESNIPNKSIDENSPIEKVFIKPRESKAVHDAVEAIEDADIIVLGPGSLYTSIIPNLLIQNIRRSLIKSRGIKVYISNIMTQPGETEGYTVSKHVNTILNHCPCLKLDYILINNGIIPNEIREKYQREASQLIQYTEVDASQLKDIGVHVIADDFIEIKKDYVRHDAIKLSKIIVELVLKEMLKGKNLLQYWKMKNVLKENNEGNER